MTDSDPANFVGHHITIDEDQSNDSTDRGGTMFKAFCTDECGWSGERWHHSDEYADRTDKHPDDLAHDAATLEGADHIADIAEPDQDDLAWARGDLLNPTDDEVYEVAAARARVRAREAIIRTDV